MPITDANEVKILVKQSINPTDLARAVDAGDRKIVALTNVDVEDWDPNDNAYGQLQAIGAAYAAWTVLMGWDREMYLDKAREMRKAYEFEVQQFQKMHLPEDKANQNIQIAESEYTHYKLNPDYLPFLSDY